MASVVLVGSAFSVVLFLPVLLRFSPLDRRSVMANGATHGGPHNGMVREMSGDAPDNGALDTSRCLRRFRRSCE